MEFRQADNDGRHYDMGGITMGDVMAKMDHDPYTDQ